MTCKLCQKNCELRESHIIPDAFYAGADDKKHRAMSISMERSKVELLQSGIHEKLLCGDCEQKLSKWETILSRDLVDLGKKKSRFLNISHIDESLLKVEGIRYKEFKLAVLSILWRMSIASNPFFKSYKLGAYEEKIRQRLLDENAGDEKKYPIMVSRYELDGIFYPDIIMGFPPGKYDQRFTVQIFMIWGHRFDIIINDKIAPRIPTECFLRSSGELFVDILSHVELASPKSVLSKIDDEQVKRMYASIK